MKYIKWAVAGFLALMLTSWVARQCRPTPKPPKEIPAQVDPGTPTPGPVVEAPTAPTTPTIATPQLSKEEVLALAKKYGLVLAQKPAQVRPNSGGGAVAPPSQPEAPAEPFTPRIFSEETFRHAGSGAAVDVSAWQLAEGGRIVLVGKWAPWQPPPLPEPSYFENKGKWEGILGIGAAGTEDGAGGSLLLGLGFRGIKIGHGTLGIDALGMPVLIDGKVKGQAGIYATLHIN
jgi:hypothetical protein